MDHAWLSHTSAGPLQKIHRRGWRRRGTATMADVLEADRKPDGELRQDNVFRYVIGAKPCPVE
ncbi:MAG: hypothetical protein QOI76_3892 [Frankiales bacterium]|nr:hypothetical protein [Frankiales bacterium]